jgi:SAM-dependent methyltransferase
MKRVNFAYLTRSYATTPPQLVGMYPLGGGALLEAPYRHYFEVRHFKKLVALTKDMNVLELGSGNGRWVNALAPLVKHYTAVDLTPEAVAIARDTAAKNGIRNVALHETSISDFKGERLYDLIYFSGVSQFLQDDELGQVIDTLNACTKSSTAVIDRSTLNFGARSVTDTSDYYSIYRTPEELDAVFREYGYARNYRKTSYRYMRGASRLQRHPRIERELQKIIPMTQPLSLYLMLFVSFVADVVNPIDPVARGWSHDFSRFEKL